MNHDEKVKSLSQQLKQISALGKQVKVLRNSGNITHSNLSADNTMSIDMRSFDNILGIDLTSQTIDVEPGIAMDKLAAYTLKYGFIPPVIPEFPGITVGGAIQGGALESSSFKFGQLNENIIELELLLGNGERLIATPGNEYADLFWGVSTSYGSLALITRVKLKLIRAHKYVSIRMRVFKSPQECSAALISETTEKEIDFLEGIVFSDSQATLISGKFSDTATEKVQNFKYNISPWYYRFVREQKDGFAVSVPTYDYLFRYDKGAFWMGEYLFPIFGLTSNKVTRSLFAPFLHTRKLYDGLRALGLSKDYVIQDFYLAEQDVPKVLNLNTQKANIYPIWLCPIKASSQPQRLSSNYSTKSEILLNVGVYGKPSGDAALVTKEFEDLILESKESRKMLYAECHSTKEQFWQKYDHPWYSELREKYYASTFADVYSKVSSSKNSLVPKKQAMFKLMRESLLGKNVVWR